MSAPFPQYRYTEGPAQSTRSQISDLPELQLPTPHRIRRTPKNTMADHGLTPAPFNGHSTGEHFLKQFEAFVSYKGIKDPQIGPTFSLLLRDKALDWFSTLSADQVKVWETVKTQFSAHFTHLNEWDRPRKIYDTKQQPGEPVLDYITKIAAMGKDVLAPDSLVTCIISGLLPADRLFIIQQPHTTINELMTAARLLTTTTTTMTPPDLTSQLHSITAQLNNLQTTINTRTNISAVNNFRPSRQTNYRQQSYSGSRVRSPNAQNRYSSPHRQRSPSPRRGNETRTCGFCGGKYHSVLRNCPARGKTCLKCGKLNHFRRMCRSQTYQQ